MSGVGEALRDRLQHVVVREVPRRREHHVRRLIVRVVVARDPVAGHAFDAVAGPEHLAAERVVGEQGVREQVVIVPLQCLIVDDSELFLDTARVLLEREGIQVVGVASTGAQARRSTAELEPDVVLVDIALGDESGFDVARELATVADGARPNIILISTRDATDVADLVAESPALGFLSKGELSAAAIRDLLRGHRAESS